MSFNQNSPTIRRLMTELKELRKSNENDFVAGPIGQDIFVWHFTIKGPRDSPFEGGIYHGKIIFPQNYPYSPPDIYFLTPNGRFETNRKICLTMTSFHPDQWNPAWDVRTTLTSIIAFMPTPAEGAVGAIDMPESDRRKLAKASHDWHCQECELHIEPDELPNPDDKKSTQNSKAQTSTAANSQNDRNSNTNEVDEQTTEDSQNINPDEEVLDEINLDVDFHVDNDNSQDETQVNPAVEEHQEQEYQPEQEQPPEDISKDAQTTEVHENAEGDHVYIDENGISHYNYEEMRSIPIEKKHNFILILDVPILILFLLLMFLIANSAFHFVDFFDFQ